MEQSSTTRDLCTAAGDIQAASKNISLSLVKLSYPDPWSSDLLTALFNRGASCLSTYLSLTGDRTKLPEPPTL